MVRGIKYVSSPHTTAGVKGVTFPGRDVASCKIGYGLHLESSMHSISINNSLAAVLH